jgi:N-methylhydantoinase A
MGRHEARIFRRERLLAGDELEGPAVVEEPAANTVVFPGQRVDVDEFGCLAIRTEAA